MGKIALRLCAMFAMCLCVCVHEQISECGFVFFKHSHTHSERQGRIYILSGDVVFMVLCEYLWHK